MSIKISISTSKQAELDEIMQVLNPIVVKRNYRVKRKLSAVSGNERFVAYIGTKQRFRFLKIKFPDFC